MNPTDRRAYMNRAKDSGPMSNQSSTLSTSHNQSGVTGIRLSMLAHTFFEAQRPLQMKESHRQLSSRQHSPGSIRDVAKTTHG